MTAFHEPHDDCEACGERRPSYDMIHYGSGADSRLTCSRCFNADMARRHDVRDFQNVRLEPVKMVDRSGATHLFHFLPRLLGDRFIIEAFEVEDGHPAGYQFAVLDGPHVDIFVLLGRLVEKMRRALAVQYLSSDHDDQLAGQVAKGTITSTLDGDRMPVMVIDGHEIDWDTFGRMLVSYEGWQFRLEIADPGEEL